MTPFGSVRSWSCTPPAVDAVRILRVHGYSDPEKVRPQIREAAAKASGEAARLAAPDARYVSAQILSLERGVLRLSGDCTLECAAFEQHLTGGRHLLAFVMTLGPALDETVMSLVEDVFEPLDALFLETAGWLTIEAATRQFAREIKQRLDPLGWRLSLRMGPGYEYRTQNGAGRVRWDLWQQRELFRMFGEEPLPVLLMESCAMKPKMSRSGVFGLLAAQGGA